MRTTEVRGTVSPWMVRHTMRARMNCRTRTAGGTLLSRLLTSTVCVASSTRAAMKLMGLVAMTLFSPSSS